MLHNIFMANLWTTILEGTYVFMTDLNQILMSSTDPYKSP